MVVPLSESFSPKTVVENAKLLVLPSPPKVVGLVLVEVGSKGVITTLELSPVVPELNDGLINLQKKKDYHGLHEEDMN